MNKKILYYLVLVLVFIALWAVAIALMMLVGGKRPGTLVMFLGVGLLFGVFGTLKPLIKKKMKIK